MFLIALLIPIDNQIIKIAIYVIAYLVVGFEVLKEAIEKIEHDCRKEIEWFQILLDSLDEVRKMLA